MSSNHNLISLTSVSNLRLEHFRTQHELARNFYDDQEFCPVYQVEEVAEHRERIQKRTSPYPSPSHSPPSYYISPKQQRPHINHQTSSSSTRAIPIIDPSNMTPVSVPMQQQQYTMKSNSSTSPSMAQWIAYKNSTINTTSPTSSNNSVSSLSSSSSTTTNSTSSNNINHQTNSIQNYNNYYYGNNNCSSINYNNHYQPQQQQPQMVVPIVARAIPIIDPSTRQVYRQQQHTPNVPPGFYNVSVY